MTGGGDAWVEGLTRRVVGGVTSVVALARDAWVTRGLLLSAFWGHSCGQRGKGEQNGSVDDFRFIFKRYVSVVG